MMSPRVPGRTFWIVFILLLLVSVAAYGFLYGRGSLSPPTSDQIRQAIRAQDWNRAERLLGRLARASNPEAEGLVPVLHAELDVARGDMDQAIERLRSIPTTNPLAPHARTMAGQIEMKRYRARFAEALFVEALALEPALTLARRDLVYIYGMQARRAELNAQYQALSKALPLSYDEVFVWTTSLEDIWVNDTIRPTLERFLEADPDDRPSRMALAQVLLLGNEVERAEALIAPLPETDADVRVMRARLALGRRDPDEARRIIGEGADENVPLAVLRGQIALQSGDLEKAERQFRMVLGHDPANREAIHGMVLVLSRLGKAEKARTFLDQEKRWRDLTELLLKANTRDASHHPEMLRALGEHCEAVGRVDEARSWYQVGLALDPLDASLQRCLFRLRPSTP